MCIVHKTPSRCLKYSLSKRAVSCHGSPAGYWLGTSYIHDSQLGTREGGNTEDWEAKPNQATAHDNPSISGQVYCLVKFKAFHFEVSI